MGRLRLSIQKDRPFCSNCSVNQCKISGKSKLGFIKYSKFCAACEAIFYNKKTSSGRAFSYRLHKKSKCERCGFTPEHSCQLDVDHINGNCSDNDLDNLQTLCANCHRLKTYMERNKKANP